MSLVKEGPFIMEACQRRPCPPVATSPDHGLNSVAPFDGAVAAQGKQSQPPSARQSYDKAVLILKMPSCSHTHFWVVCAPQVRFHSQEFWI